MLKSSACCMLLLLIVAMQSVVAETLHNKPKMLLVGAGGKQAQLYFQLLKDQAEFTGFVVRSINESITTIAKTYAIQVFDNVDMALEKVDFDIALVSLPHNLHHDVTVKLLAKNKIIIKEKPLACSSSDLSLYTKQGSEFDQLSPALFTIVQRNFQEPFFKAKEDMSLIGIPYYFHYSYHMNLAHMTTGWRSKYEIAKGGVLLDMGYHVIDIINDFFGMPTLVHAQFSYCYEAMQQEQLEDHVHILLGYGSKHLAGNITISRHYHERKEEFIIQGTMGSLIITPQGYTVIDRNGVVIKEYITALSKEDERLNMLTCYLDNLTNPAFINAHFQRHKDNVMLIESIYQSGSR